MNIDRKQQAIRTQRARLFGNWHAWWAVVATPGFVVTSIVALSLLQQLRFLLWSDIHFLAVMRMQDDSFYYLQPAWQLRATGMFTFDGETPTYGFQPLWMLLLAGVSFASADKVVFLRAALVLGACLYSATGLLLYRLSCKFTTGWKTVIAPTVWLINPPLFAVYTTGKENALYAFLLVLVVLGMYRIMNEPVVNARYAAYGSVCGLLVLARINSLMFVAMLVIFVLCFSQSLRRWDRIRAATLILVGALLVALPWAVYSYAALGSLFPNSGTQKLIGAKAALLVAISRAVPLIPSHWLAALLPGHERLFLQAPDRLPVPSIAQTGKYILAYLPTLSLGSWLGNAIAVVLGRRVELRWLPQCMMLIGAGVLLSYRLCKHIQAIVMSRAVYLNTLRQHIAILLLFIFAGANALANSLLLPQHIYYATWYAVPETIAIVLLGSFTAILAWKAAPRKARTAWVALALVLLSVSEPLYEWYTDLAPRAYSADGGSLHEAWEADLWAEQHLPTGARVGSLSSGLLGYFMQDRTVINLDGLANSPEYVRTVWLHHLLYTHGLAQDGELWAYIRANDIQYIANPEWESGLGQRPFLEIIPLSNYEIVYRGQQLIQWGEPEGPRRYVIVKLRY